MNKTFTTQTIGTQKYQFLALPGSDLFKFEIINLLGSNVERTVERITGKNLYGIAHFIEHLGFRAPKDYTTDELVSTLKSEGTYNASTDHDRINYWFKTTSNRMHTAIKLVCNYALNDLTQIPPEEFALENKVVYNEAKRYADDDQTMFYFNMVSALNNYHAEDNVIGLPATIQNFTLEDAVEIKKIMINYGDQVINITYDPEQLTIDNIVKEVEYQLIRFRSGPFSSKVGEGWKSDLKYPEPGRTAVNNESEQILTGLVFDTITDIFVAKLGNAYLAHYSDSSLTDIIREKNGLTYGIGFYNDTISFKPYTMFSCDVTRGDEDKLIQLIQSSISESTENFDEEAYNKLLRTVDLQRVLRNINLSQHDALFWLSLWYPVAIKPYQDILAKNIDDAYRAIDGDCSFGAISKYIGSVKQVATDQSWSRVNN